MRLPSQTAGYGQRVRYGRYVVAQLKFAGQKADLIELAQTATQTIKAMGRKMEDAAEPVQDAIAQRDFFDNLLRRTVSEFRLKLAATSLDAKNKAPYTHLFPKGSEYYNSRPVTEVVSRTNELISRVEVHLPESDTLKLPIIGQLTEGVEGFEGAMGQLNEARIALALCRDNVKAEKSVFDATMVKIYGSLLADIGKKNANEFFPKSNTYRSGEKAD